MKHLWILSLLLVSCVRFNSPVPWKQPDNADVICNGATCCYPTSERTQMCVTNGLFNDNPNYYYLVIKH